MGAQANLKAQPPLETIGFDARCLKSIMPWNSRTASSLSATAGKWGPLRYSSPSPHVLDDGQRLERIVPSRDHSLPIAEELKRFGSPAAAAASASRNDNPSARCRQLRWSLPPNRKIDCLGTSRSPCSHPGTGFRRHQRSSRHLVDVRLVRIEQMRSRAQPAARRLVAA